MPAVKNTPNTRAVLRHNPSTRSPTRTESIWVRGITTKQESHARGLWKGIPASCVESTRTLWRMSARPLCQTWTCCRAEMGPRELSGRRDQPAPQPRHASASTALASRNSDTCILIDSMNPLPNGSRLSCCALKKNFIPQLARAASFTRVRRQHQDPFGNSVRTRPLRIQTQDEQLHQCGSRAACRTRIPYSHERGPIPRPPPQVIGPHPACERRGARTNPRDMQHRHSDSPRQKDESTTRQDRPRAPFPLLPAAQQVVQTTCQRRISRSPRDAPPANRRATTHSGAQAKPPRPPLSRA